MPFQSVMQWEKGRKMSLAKGGFKLFSILFWPYSPCYRCFLYFCLDIDGWS